MGVRLRGLVIYKCTHHSFIGNQVKSADTAKLDEEMNAAPRWTLRGNLSLSCHFWYLDTHIACFCFSESKNVNPQDLVTLKSSSHSEGLSDVVRLWMWGVEGGWEMQTACVLFASTDTAPSPHPALLTNRPARFHTWYSPSTRSPQTHNSPH